MPHAAAMSRMDVPWKPFSKRTLLAPSTMRRCFISVSSRSAGPAGNSCSAVRSCIRVSSPSVPFASTADPFPVAAAMGLLV